MKLRKAKNWNLHRGEFDGEHKWFRTGENISNYAREDDSSLG